MLFGSSIRTAIHHLIAVSLTALAFFTFTPSSITLAQGPPSYPVSGNALGNSPFANYGRSEVPITVEGILTILHGDDFANQREQLYYFLRNLKTNETLELRFSDKAPGHLRSGATVRARGRAKGRELYLALDESGQESIQTVLPATSVVAGNQNTIVMVTNFIDAAVSCSVSDIQNLMFTDPQGNSIDSLYQEVSFGNVWFSGDVFEYAIDYSIVDPCDPFSWAIAAEDAAQAEGIDLNSYNRRVFVLPEGSTCGWSGLASLGGNPSRSWIQKCDAAGVYSHEIGHNLGMNHASTLTYEYGDTSDFMGVATSRMHMLNAPHKEQMGWLAPDQIVPVNSTGIYDVAPLELESFQSSLPRSTKIAKTNSGDYYYLSYRQPIGFDTNLASAYFSGISIHTYPGDGTASRTYLIDTLSDGETFLDEANGISITQISHSAESVTIEVQLEATEQTCTPAVPLMEISPSIQSAAPGTTLFYNVTLTNTDSAECLASTFSMSSLQPDGWSGGLSNDTVTLAPGQQSTTNLWIISPDVATEASYDVSVRIADGLESLHTLTSSASYSVETVCQASTPIVTISPTSQSGPAGTILSYDIKVTNTDTESCMPGSFDVEASLPEGWTATISDKILPLSPGQIGTATLSLKSPDGAEAATYGFTVNISETDEPAHSTSFDAKYVVQASTNEDIDPPTEPSDLSARIAGTNVKLDWSASTDNVGVSGYAIWRDGVRVGDTPDIRFVDKLPSDQTGCTYIVTAYDAAGNVSGASNPVSLSWKPKK